MGFSLGNIIGKKVIAIKGIVNSRTYKPGDRVWPEYVLFDDGKTYITFEEQDTYQYHDADEDAKIIVVHENKKQWERIFKLNYESIKDEEFGEEFVFEDSNRDFNHYY